MILHQIAATVNQEKAQKDGWNHEEHKVKAAAKAKERMGKEVVAKAAEAIREKTRKRMEERAQKELMLQDNVKSAHTNHKMRVDDLKTAKKNSELAIKEIKRLQEVQRRATRELAKAADFTEEHAVRAKYATSEKVLETEKAVQLKHTTVVKKEDSKIPVLMKEIADADNTEKKSSAQEKTAKLATKEANNPSELTMTEAADAAAKATMSHAQALKKKDGKGLKVVQAIIAKSRAIISQSQDKEDIETTNYNKYGLKIKEIVNWRQRTKDENTVLLKSSKYKEKMEIKNEKHIKSTLGAKMKAIVSAKEKHVKALLKLKEWKDRVKVLDKKLSKEKDEQKVKLCLGDREKKVKRESKANDELKAARTCVKEGEKQLVDAQLATATAITMDQKVKAADLLSKAEMNKASCATKLKNAEPTSSKAKETEAKQDATCQSLIAKRASAAAKLREAKAKKDAARKRLMEARRQGRIDVAKKDAEIAIKLANKEARLRGVRVMARKKAVEQAKKVHAKAKAAKQKVLEIKAKIKRKKAAARRAAMRAAAKLANTPMGIRAYLIKLKSHEGILKKQIHIQKNMDHMKNVKYRTAAHEQTAKARSNNHEKTTKESRQKVSRVKQITTKEHKVELALAVERGNKAKARGSAEAAGLVGGRCTGLGTQAGESCAKSRAKSLLTREKSVKNRAYAKERKVKRVQNEKDRKERRVKSEKKSKADARKAKRREIRSKEKGTKKKEKNQKFKAKTEKQKKVLKEKESKKREKKKKSDERLSKKKERHTKKMTAEKRRKQVKLKETKKKAAVKEKKGKEKSKKSHEKQAKEAKNKEKKKKSDEKKSKQGEEEEVRREEKKKS